MDLVKIAERLDAEEQLKLKYKTPVAIGGSWQSPIVRMDKLLDVEPERDTLFVSFRGEAIWIRIDEALEVLPDDGVYGEATDH